VLTTDAYATCQRLARTHYENVPVASWLMPPQAHPHIAAIYAFARIADDFADEDTRTIGLDWMVRHHNRHFQLARQSGHAPARSTVRVCEWAGLVTGGIAVLMANRLIESVTYGIPALSVDSLMAGCVAFCAVALLGAIFPILKALRVSPAILLKL